VAFDVVGLAFVLHLFMYALADQLL